MKTYCKQCDQGGPVNDKGLCLPCAVKPNAERRRHPPQAEPQVPLPYGFESGLVQLLNEARCLESRIVGNRELASRIVDYIRRGIGKQEGK